METSSQLPSEFAPVSEHLIVIYEKLPDAALAAEEQRLREQFSEIGSKIMAISQIRGAE